MAAALVNLPEVGKPPLTMRVKLATILKFLSLQAIPKVGSLNTERNENFAATLEFIFKIEYGELMAWLAESAGNATLSQFQDQMLTKMYSNVLCELEGAVEDSLFCALMVDQVVEIPQRYDEDRLVDEDGNFDNSIYNEKAVLVLRWVDEQLEVHEAFIGLCIAVSISPNDIISMIKDGFRRLKLSFSKVRGQCYDGEAIMGSVHTEVVKQVSILEKRAVFTHCYSQSLMRDCEDALRKSLPMNMGISAARGVMKLMECNRRAGAFYTLKPVLSPDALGERVLCPTRWTVSADGLLSVLSNYSLIQTTLEERNWVTHDGSSAFMLKTQLQMFETLFGMMLAETLLRHCDILSRALEAANLSTTDQEELSNLTVTTLRSLRCEKDFELFWDKLDWVMETVDVEEASLPRQRSKHSEEKSDPPSTPKDLYRQHYYEAVDLLVDVITERFNRPGLQVYRRAENLLLDAAHGLDYNREDFDFVVAFYEGDFDRTVLSDQLRALRDCFKYCDDQSTLTLQDICKHLTNPTMDFESCDHSQVTILAAILLVTPLTRGTEEESLSALRRIRNYPRTEMDQAMLERLMLLHVNREITEGLVLEELFAEDEGTT